MFSAVSPNPTRYARSAPFATHLMDMDDGQRVYVEEAGNARGTPLVFLHGGPGFGLGTGGYAGQADPARFRIIGFDQRGCGRSTPLAIDPAHELGRNTTPRMVQDMEQIRVRLGVEAWVINAVSCGSTLALAYAQEHPERVLGIVLMAVNTSSRFEVDCITETVGTLYPEQWDLFAGHAEQVGIGYRRGEGRLVDAYRRLMLSPDPQVRRDASWAWARWEDAHATIGSGFSPRDRWRDDTFRESFVTLATHYWAHNGFSQPPLLQLMDRLAGIPGFLVHGRRDVSGPSVTPWVLHRAWPASQLFIIENEGHGGPEMVATWRGANDNLAQVVNPDHG